MSEGSLLRCLLSFGVYESSTNGIKGIGSRDNDVYETRLCGDLGRGKNFVFEYCTAAPGTTTTTETPKKKKKNRSG